MSEHLFVNAEKIGVRPKIGMRVKFRAHPGDEKQPPYPVFTPA